MYMYWERKLFDFVSYFREFTSPSNGVIIVANFNVNLYFEIGTVLLICKLVFSCLIYDDWTPTTPSVISPRIKEKKLFITLKYLYENISLLIQDSYFNKNHLVDWLVWSIQFSWWEAAKYKKACLSINDLHIILCCRLYLLYAVFLHTY